MTTKVSTITRARGEAEKACYDSVGKAQEANLPEVAAAYMIAAAGFAQAREIARLADAIEAHREQR